MQKDINSKNANVLNGWSQTFIFDNYSMITALIQLKSVVKLSNNLQKYTYFRNGLECNLHLCGEEKYLTCKCCPYKFDFENADEVDCDICDEDNQLFSEPLL